MCECRAAVNKRLAFSNSKIAEGLVYGNAAIEISPPMIILEKIDKAKRGKPPTLLATCCPFCGERYQEPALSSNINKCPVCYRMFKDGDTCVMGGCPMGGDV